MQHEYNYPSIQTVIEIYHACLGASEAHGVLTGMLCVDPATLFEEWVEELFVEGLHTLNPMDRQQLRHMYQDTREQLLEPEDFSFMPLLPDDDDVLSLRVQNLGEWCQGFMYGLGSKPLPQEFSAETQEVLHDLAQISQVQFEDTDDMDEEPYNELVEFVRIVVHLLHSELQNTRIPASSSLH